MITINLYKNVHSKICTKCDKFYEYKYFSKNKNTKDGYHIWCKLCKNKFTKNKRLSDLEKAREIDRNYYSNNRDKKKASILKYSTINRNKKYKRIYGVDYNEMYLIQKGKCYICNINKDILCIDHNHTTGKVRKLLCSGCNSGIGFFKENTDILNKTILYLKEHNG